MGQWAVSVLEHVRVDLDLEPADSPRGDLVGEPGGPEDRQQAFDDAQPLGPGGNGGQWRAGDVGVRGPHPLGVVGVGP